MVECSEADTGYFGCIEEDGGGKREERGKEERGGIAVGR